ncbi:hypothetical protein KM043_009987 [Ampulex compressa]|nr:hypothetical protein KM043_009987 [Ampulex compressa]
MMLFDFLKKLFGWADEAPRKRRAVSFSLEKEFVTPKKHKYDYKTSVDKEEVVEIEKDSDSDDMEIIADHKYSPVYDSTKLNGSYFGREKSYNFCTSPTFSFPHKSRPCHSKLNMGYFSSKDHKTHNIGMDHKCLTLAKTHKLREKSQYEELLQNFLPHRVHVIRNKRQEQRSVQEPIEVIDIDKPVISTPSNKIQHLQKTPNASSHARWCTAHRANKDKENVITIDFTEKNNTVHSPIEKVRASIATSSTAKASQNNHKECVATNTLRDQLAAKAVMREDFIPQVAKRYNERIEQRCKEVEELKKMTCVLSKHNRLTREAALEEQLARSMRLCEAVLDEREEPEELALPTLNDEMLQEVKNALIPRPPDEVLVEGFGLRITRKDIHTLADLNWLNDEVINFYMNLLIARSTNDKYPKVHAMNTFFYPKLISGGHASLKRWTRKVDIFAQDLIVVPVHLGIHWCMSIIDFRNMSIRYYDSMGSNNLKCLSALRQYLEEESLDKKKQAYDTSGWKLECAKNIPQQMNGSDCGVFSCMFAEYICANRKITFSQQDMPYFRNKMVYEILKSKLL